MRRIIVTDLGDWLLKALEQRGWSQADLARATKRSRTAISDVVSGKRQAGKSLLVDIARVLNEPPENLFRLAGILPPDPKADEWVRDMMHKIDQLNPNQRKLAEWLINKLANDEDL